MSNQNLNRSQQTQPFRPSFSLLRGSQTTLCAQTLYLPERQQWQIQSLCLNQLLWQSLYLSHRKRYHSKLSSPQISIHREQLFSRQNQLYTSLNHWYPVQT